MVNWGWQFTRKDGTSCDAKVILLTATPYNKTKADLFSQLRLFIDEKANIGIRPEHYMRKLGISEAEFERKHQCKVNSILAIEKSDAFDDWRELIRLYMVRPLPLALRRRLL